MGETSRYAYMLFDCGLFRVSIPELDKEQNYEFKLECVVYNSDSWPITFRTMGLFSQGDDVCLVGGSDFPNDKDNCSMYIFNPSTNINHKYPIKDTQSLSKSSVQCQPMVDPFVIRAEHQIYFFSIVPPYQKLKTESPFSFQSFDTTNNSFLTLQPPPTVDSAMSYGLEGHFVVFDYVYLFIEGLRRGPNKMVVHHAFSFNTISSTWKEMNSILTKFQERNIPIPHGHNGDIGLSGKYHDGTRILVALDFGITTAYRVCLGKKGGSLEPRSYRRLIVNPGGRYNMSHLLDIGGKRFLVIYSGDNDTLDDTPLLVFVFKMKFEVEYKNRQS